MLDAINVRPAGIDLRVVYSYLASLHRCVGVTKPDGCDKDISYFEKVKVLIRDIDGVSGLLESYEAKKITCYLDFDRCDEAVVRFGEAHNCGFLGFRATEEKWVLKVADRLDAKEKPKCVFDVLHLVFDEIERCWKPNSQFRAYDLLANSSEDCDEDISYYKKAKELEMTREEIDVKSGLEFFQSQIIIFGFG